MKPPCGAGEDYCSLRCIGGPLPPLASLSGVESGMSFLFGSGFCVSLILIGVPFGFVARPHSGVGPLCGTSERLLVGFMGALHTFLRSTEAALGIFLGLEVTYFALIFLFFVFFAHITFQFVSCFFGFGLCQSRRNICPRPRPSRLGSGRPNGSAYLSNASAVELHALQNLRPFFPSTNSHPPITTIRARRFFVPTFSAIRSF